MVRTPRDGGYLTPGLIDNHWHCMLALDYAVVFSSPTQHLDAIATWEAKQILMRGVTTVRDAGGNKQWLAISRCPFGGTTLGPITITRSSNTS